MKKDILILCGVYCLAVWAAVYMPQIDTSIVFLFLLLLLAIRLICFRGRQLFVVAVILCAGLGFARAAYTNNVANFMPVEFEGLPVYVKGVVQETTQGADYYCYILEPEQISVDTTRGDRLYAEAKAKIAVTVYERDETREAYAYGDRIMVRGTFTLPDTPNNEGAFDFGLWYKTDDVYTAITTTESYVKYIDAAPTNPILRAAYAVRTYITKTVRDYIGGDAGALLSGILVSDRSAMSDDLKASISDTGLSHICAASGMHVSMLYGILLWIFVRLRFRRWFYYPICAGLLHFFALVAGGGPSITRAVLMFDFCALAFFTRGDEDRLFTCLCVGFLMLLFEPLYLFSVGFLLSFACVFGILLFSERLEAFLYRYLKWHPLSSAVAVSLCAIIATLPILAVNFHTLPLYSLLYNVLLVWLVSPLMVLAIVFLLVSLFWPFGAHVVAFVLKLMLQGMCAAISAVRYLPFATVAIETPGIIGCLFYYVVLFGVYAYLTEAKWYAVFCNRLACACVFVLIFSTLVSSFYARLQFINVGEGDSALLRLPGGMTVLLDGGGVATYSDRNIGKDTVLPYLQHCGVNEIDYAVVSHYDADHAQGVLYICENMRVKNLILPYRHPLCEEEYKTLLEQCAAKRGIRVQYMQGGDSVTLPGGLRFDALSPDAEMLEYRGVSENDLSLVMRISYGETRMLFTGDMEKLAEQRLYLAEADVQAQILKVAHHGAKTSSTDRFIDRIVPQYAVVSAGNYAINAHPAKRTVVTLERVGAEVYNTATAGDITFYFRKSGVKWIE